MTNRLARFEISQEMLVQLLQGTGIPVKVVGFPDPPERFRFFATNIPPDMEILHVEWNFCNKTIVITATSESFDPVEGKIPGAITTIPVRCFQAYTNVASIEELWGAAVQSPVSQEASTTGAQGEESSR